MSIVFASQPLGAQVHLDGQSIGVTPLMDHPVQVGEHTLGFTLGSEQMESVITVGPRHPTRHFWRVGDRIEASY